MHSALLSPLSALVSSSDTVEVRMNQPFTAVVDRRGVGKQAVAANDLSLARLERIARSLANGRGVTFDGECNNRLSCVLPGGHRFELLVGPSVGTGLSLAIRCKHPFTPTWAEWGCSEEVQAFLIAAVKSEANLVVSGATNTGKTTLLNMLLSALPEGKRVVAMEDTPELHLTRFSDGLSLLASRNKDGVPGMASWDELYDHAMRITPDHIIFGEISTSNAEAALGVMNAGNKGFMCTIHASSPEQVIFRKFEQNLSWSGKTFTNTHAYLQDRLDLVVQIERRENGWRTISNVFDVPNSAAIFENGTINQGALKRAKARLQC